MTFDFNEIYFEPLQNSKARYIDIWGGRGRGASHFVTDYFLYLMVTMPYFRGFFMREIYGDIRESLFRDFKDRIESQATENQAQFKITEAPIEITYLPNGNTLTAKGFKKSSNSAVAKVKSLANPTHVAIEEATEVNRHDFEKLDDSFRTDKVEQIQIFKMFNPPPKSHWIIKDNYNLIPSAHDGYFKGVLKEDREEFLSIHSCYLDNETNLNQLWLDKINRYKREALSDENKKEHYLVEYLGLIPAGSMGRVFKSYDIFTKLPENEYFRIFGLDFGYTHDPSCLMDLSIDKKKRDVYAKECFYVKGLTTDQLYLKIKEHLPKNVVIIADSAEGRLIDELIYKGLFIIKAKKGAGSIKQGIQQMLSFSWFLNGENVINEFNNHSYKRNVQGEYTGDFEDTWNHAVDACRYALSYYSLHYGFKYK